MDMEQEWHSSCCHKEGTFIAMDLKIYALPAILALAAKAVIYLYARFSELRTLETRLYLWFLFALSVQNLAEVGIFASYAEHLPFVYFGASIIAITLLLHLALVVAREWRPTLVWLVLLYAPSVILEILLWFTPLLVQRFEPLLYTYTRVPGSLYFLFELYALGYVAGAVALCIYGSLWARTAPRQIKNRLTLLGLFPIFLVVIAVVSLQHYGMRAFNTTVTLPIAITFFLAVTAYATHQYRLFDIAFFIPWSKVRARKTAFYNRIRAMISEIADLGSVREAVHRLADTLRCPVALVSTGKPVLAVAGGGQPLAAFPLEQLRQIDRIVVANEIADTAPQTCALMRQHNIAAIVPFYPHSQNASGWMLLGDAFSEQVYTPLDFKMVEQLFDKMAELFLDKLLFMRNQLAASERRLQTLELHLQQAQTGIVALRGENESLRGQSLRLAREQAADSLLVTHAPEQTTLPSIVLLGRDKPLLKRLRRHFPQADQYVGPDSASFRRQGLPEVLVCQVENDADSHDELLSLIAQNKGRLAVLIYDEGAQAFMATHKTALAGTLIERLPDTGTDEVFVRRIQALAGLQRAVHTITDADCPFAGVSQHFHETMRELARLAGFTEPVLIESPDTAEIVAAAHALHERSGRHGDFGSLLTTAQQANAKALQEQLGICRGGTLLVMGLENLPLAERDEILKTVLSVTGMRVILGLPDADEALRARFRSFTLRLPTLCERRLDLPLLVHYFTLQYNLRAQTQAYLTQGEVDDLMAEDYPATLSALKAAVFDRLNAKNRETAPVPEMTLALVDKTLEEHVAAFEAHLIAQTLKRCQGNKSKAARLLGLRPNTLHYKIERYGLNVETKDKSGND
ncbi:MAG: hypothetical protein A2V91_01350 [Candidatus Muproteobacteria bacterium RBG_16_64_10]|uniref:Sigma-54 factor interaction domain-containing protein n=1 Tax=Candidatus Muproteobacteria bacterium RBG_16_64_10 TaxID=1817757 RepID=A0A1F6T701_9PROT|nr:MAG: hypothetical protein A2V91_01350 [Candidatus Muproteobacteria bacterium RBG_16_64_10]